MGDGYDMTDLLNLAVAERVEKLELRTGQLIKLHIRGEVHPIEGSLLSPENAESLIRTLAGTRQMREFRKRNAIAFFHNFQGFQGAAQFQVQARSEDSEIKIEVLRLGDDISSRNT